MSFHDQYRETIYLIQTSGQHTRNSLHMSWGSFMWFIWTRSPPSVIVRSWKAATASFKESKMTNEFAQLSHRQRRPLPWQPHKVTCREGNRAVCHMPNYLPQMRNDSVGELAHKTEIELKMLCVGRDENVYVLCQHILLSWHVIAYLKLRDREGTLGSPVRR